MPPLLSKAYFFFLTILITTPIAFLLGQSIFVGNLNDQESWEFIFNNSLWGLVKDTTILAILTVSLSLALGLLQAIVISFTDLKMKKFFHTLFVLPLIFPLYVLSFIYVGSFEYSGAIPEFFRNAFNIDISKLLPIKSSLGVACVFSLALTPYVYLFLRSAFVRIDKNLILSARSLGQGPRQILTKLLIPQIRPWIYSAAILVFLEVLCDFGGVSVFNYDTFSTAIYHALVGFFSLNTAVKLSMLPTIFALLLYATSHWFQYRFTNKGKVNKLIVLFELKRGEKTLLASLLFIYCFFSVLFPMGQLLHWAWSSFFLEINMDYVLLVVQTLGIGLVAALLINFLSLFLSFLSRIYFSWMERFSIIFVKIGYAIPGSIIAISIISLFSHWNANFFGFFAFITLFLGYSIRFFPIAFEMQNKSYGIISRKLDWMSNSLGKGPLTTFFKIHLPLLTPALLSSFVMVLIEVIKEMPLTLILRPYGVNTLPTKIYELTSEGEWERASLSGSILVLIGALFIFSSESYYNRIGAQV